MVLQRRSKCYFGDLRSKSSRAIIQPRISPIWAFHQPSPTFLIAVTALCLDSLSHWVWVHYKALRPSSCLKKGSFYGSFVMPIFKAPVNNSKHETTIFPGLQSGLLKRPSCRLSQDSMFQRSQFNVVYTSLPNPNPSCGFDCIAFIALRWSVFNSAAIVSALVDVPMIATCHR